MPPSRPRPVAPVRSLSLSSQPHAAGQLAWKQTRSELLESRTGVSGMPLSVKSCLPLAPPMFSHIVMVPLPGLNMFTHCTHMRRACARTRNSQATCAQRWDMAAGRAFAVRTFEKSLNL
jgi:hypothetical protein